MSVMQLTATSSLMGIGVGWTVERLDHMHQVVGSVPHGVLFAFGRERGLLRAVHALVGGLLNAGISRAFLHETSPRRRGSFPLLGRSKRHRRRPASGHQQNARIVRRLQLSLA